MAFLVPPVQGRPSAQIVVVSVEAAGRFPLRAFDLDPLELPGDYADDARGNLILQFEDVVEGAFEALRPNMRTRRRIDKLPCDPNAVCRFAHAAFQHIAHAQVPADLLDVHCPPFVREA